MNNNPRIKIYKLINSNPSWSYQFSGPIGSGMNYGIRTLRKKSFSSIQTKQDIKLQFEANRYIRRYLLQKNIVDNS